MCVHLVMLGCFVEMSVGIQPYDVVMAAIVCGNSMHVLLKLGCLLLLSL